MYPWMGWMDGGFEADIVLRCGEFRIAECSTSLTQISFFRLLFMAPFLVSEICIYLCTYIFLFVVRCRS